MNSFYLRIRNLPSHRKRNKLLSFGGITQANNSKEIGYYIKSSILACVLMIFILSPSSVQAQFGGCNSGSAHPAAGQPYNIPGSSSSLLTSPAYGGQYFRVNVQSGKTYSFTTCQDETGASRDFDTQLTITNTSNSILAADDDGGCQTAAKIEWTATFSGEIRLYVHAYIGGNCQTTTVQDLTWVRMQELQAKPDYTVSNLSANNSTVSAGSSLSMSLTIANIGSANGNGNGGKDRFYLSDDTSVGGGDIQIGEGSTGSLTAGVSFDVGGNVTIPSNTPSGFYYILFSIDDDDQVDESDEGNNVDYYSIEVINGGGGGQPDYVAQFTGGPNSANPGQTVTFTTQITNQGNADGSSNSQSVYYLSTSPGFNGNEIRLDEPGADGTPGLDNHPPINAGQSITENENIIIPSNTAPGTYYVLYVVDYNDDIIESNEGNNIANKQITIGGGGNQPDYTAQLTGGPNSANPGQSVSFNLTIQNIGNASGNGNGGKDKFYLSTDASLSGNDIQLGSGNTASMSGGQSFNVSSPNLTIPGNTSSGSYYILFFIDADNQVSESNEGNNVASYFISIQGGGGGQPDYVAQFTGGPNSVNPGQTVTFTTQITNQGNANGTSNSQSVYYLSTSPGFNGNEIRLDEPGADGTPGLDNNPPINAGQSITENENIIIPSNTAPGTYYVLYVVDYNDDIIESNESNNIANKQITVGGGGGNQPDYTAQFTGGPTSANPGQTVSFNLNIQNIGNASGNGNGGQDKFYLSTDTNLGGNDIQLGSGNTASMGAGQSFNVSSPNLTIPNNTSSGSYYILFFIDADNQVSESNEGNNIASYFINVQGGGGGNKPDYTAQITGGPTSIQAGQSGTYTPVITNQGNAAGQNCEARYYLSTDASFSNDDIFLNEPGVNPSPGVDFLPAIGVGQNVNENEPVIIPSNTGTGNYYILYFVDVNNDVDESNEGNNVASYPISVQGNGTAPTANFSASSTTPCLQNGQTDIVNFTDLSSESPNSHSWSFSPSLVAYQNSTNSSSPNPQVRFLAGGIYTVSLTVSNNFGSDTEVKTGYINVSNCVTPPTPNFTASNTNPCPGETVSFTNQTTGNADSYVWGFSPTTFTYQNNTNANSPNPQILFSAPGTYTVSLTATNSGGSATETKTAYITQAQSCGPTNWDVVETGDNHTVIIETTSPLLIDGSPIQVGDYIGAFYMDNGVEKCAGKVGWTGANTSVTVYGDDNSTTQKDGFSSNEVFNWKMWRASNNQEYPATATYKPTDFVITHTDRFAADGISSIATMTGSSQQTHTISLRTGWNLISTYVMPADMNIASIFSGIQSSIALAKNGSGDVYVPNPPVNTIGNWDITQGYKVKVISNTPINLQIVGQKVNPASNPIALKTGWNQIAYLRDSDQPIVTAFASIQSDIIIAKDGAGNVYSPTFNLNNIGNLRTGQGYQVKMSSGRSLTYNARMAGPIANDMHTAKLTAKNFSNVVPTDQNATVILHPNHQLSLGDEVGIFTSADKLVGSAVYEGHTLGFPIWGDDASTSLVDGLQAGESFEIKIWNQRTQKQTQATFTLEQVQNAYQKDAIFEIKLQKTTDLESGVLIANSLQLYPNPAKNATKLGLDLAETAEVSVTIFSVTGKAILSVIDQRLVGGSHELEINTSALAEGMYYIGVAVDGIPHNIPLSIIK